MCTQKFWKYECINENDLFNYETKEELINSFIKVNCTGRYYLCLNMSQLVNYIEDKTYRQVKIYPDFYKEKYYTIILRNTSCSGDNTSFEICTDSLLQSLFVVACRISV